ncbi:MAG: DUF559 domain-containing protein [Deltaproteobacteria bacterium]
MRVKDVQGSDRARELRRNQTEAEKAFWFRMRNRRLDGYKFRRQVPIGPYIADFVCMAARFVVEIDGGQHSERVDYDHRRECFLQKKGYEILRFWNNEVLENMDGVLTTLTLTLSLRERELAGNSKNRE